MPVGGYFQLSGWFVARTSISEWAKWTQRLRSPYIEHHRRWCDSVRRRCIRGRMTLPFSGAPSSEFWIGAAFVALSILAVFVTLPRQDGTNSRGALTKGQTWTAIGVVVALEIALQLTCAWLRKTHGVLPWECSLAAAAIIVGGVVAIRYVGAKRKGPLDATLFGSEKRNPRTSPPSRAGCRRCCSSSIFRCWHRRRWGRHTRSLRRWGRSWRPPGLRRRCR